MGVNMFNYMICKVRNVVVMFMMIWIVFWVVFVLLLMIRKVMVEIRKNRFMLIIIRILWR